MSVRFLVYKQPMIEWAGGRVRPSEVYRTFLPVVPDAVESYDFGPGVFSLRSLINVAQGITTHNVPPTYGLNYVRTPEAAHKGLLLNQLTGIDKTFVAVFQNYDSSAAVPAHVNELFGTRNNEATGGWGLAKSAANTFLLYTPIAGPASSPTAGCQWCEPA